MLRRAGGAGARDERGLVAVIAALTSLVLLVLAGMVVDLGFARDVGRQSQIAADASSLAAANALYPSTGLCSDSSATPCFADAVAAAKSYAASNFAVPGSAWASCTDAGHYYYPSGGSPCISFTDDTLATSRPTQPTRVRVVVPTRRVKTSLGVLAGISNVDLTRSARAALTPGQARSCGLCIIGPGISSLGNGDVTVNGGSVHSNGSIDSGPNGHMTATPSPNSISVVGTCVGNCSPTAQAGVAPITDPYASILTFPLDMTGLTVKTDPCVQGPGIYGAVSLPNSDCPLTPGLYVMTGYWGMGNNTLLHGTGVTLYGTCGTPSAPTVCAAGGSGGRLDTKNGDTQITAPTSGTLKGYAILYDRENTAGLNIQGNGRSAVTGLVYAPKALFEFPGNSCVTVTNGPIIVGQLYGNGNRGCVDLNSVIGATIPAPPAGVVLDQ